MDTLTTITRWVFCSVLVYGVMTEAGGITALAIGLGWFWLEILTVRYADKEKLEW